MAGAVKQRAAAGVAWRSGHGSPPRSRRGTTRWGARSGRGSGATSACRASPGAADRRCPRPPAPGTRRSAGRRRPGPRAPALLDPLLLPAHRFPAVRATPRRRGCPAMKTTRAPEPLTASTWSSMRRAISAISGWFGAGRPSGYRLSPRKATVAWPADRSSCRRSAIRTGSPLFAGKPASPMRNSVSAMASGSAGGSGVARRRGLGGGRGREEEGECQRTTHHCEATTRV